MSVRIPRRDDRPTEQYADFDFLRRLRTEAHRPTPSPVPRVVQQIKRGEALASARVRYSHD